MLAVCSGCALADRRANVAPEDGFVTYPKEYVMVQGPNGKTWFSGHQLISIAGHYAEEQKLDFEFEGTEKIVWVNAGGPVRADVYFSSGMGDPILHIAIDKYGRVIRHDIGTSVCGSVGR
jgi:hypothetical protein